MRPEYVTWSVVSMTYRRRHPVNSDQQRKVSLEVFPNLTDWGNSAVRLPRGLS